jgi:hypothetical protein
MCFGALFAASIAANSVTGRMIAGVIDNNL